MLDAERKSRLAAALRDATGNTIVIESIRPCSGGDINTAARLKTSAGDFFIKWNDGDAPADMFDREAEGLRELAKAGHALCVPHVVHAEPVHDGGGSFLLLEWIETGRPARDFDEQLGRGLAALHAVSAEKFGFAHDNYCGLTRQPNGWTATWGEFYAQRRIGWQAELARQRGAPAEISRRLDKLIEKLPALVDDGARPALIHGDLWSGNLLVRDDGRPAIIDPAASYSHREAEFGMTLLFGNLTRRAYGAYAEAAPLARDWESRVDLYKLYHLLNHYNLFGGHYLHAADSIVRRFL